MKISGLTITPPKPRIIAIPREDGQTYVFKATAIVNYDEFDKIVPRPVPPTITLRGGETKLDTESPQYKKAIMDYVQMKSDWMFLQTLKDSDGLEWDTVKYDEPDTWHNYENDLRNAGLTTAEINYIIGEIYQANSLDETKFEEARKRFLAGQQAQAAT